jgi:hypothetical protein
MRGGARAIATRGGWSNQLPASLSNAAATVVAGHLSTGERRPRPPLFDSCPRVKFAGHPRPRSRNRPRPALPSLRRAATPLPVALVLSILEVFRRVAATGRRF